MVQIERPSAEKTLPPDTSPTPRNSIGQTEMPPPGDSHESLPPRSHSEEDEKPLHNGNNDSDGGESAQKGPPPPVGFWDSSLRDTRKSVMLLWARTMVDFDSRVAPYQNVEPLVGPFIQQMTSKQRESPEPQLGYINRGPEFFDNDPLAVRRYIYNEGAWAAMLINANATALLRAAVETGNASYSPIGACQLIYNQARDETVYADYILPRLQQLETSLSSTFGEMWSRQVLSNNSLPRNTLSRAPQAVNPGIGFSTYNLRPFEPPATTPSVSIGLIYLIIIAFFSFTFFLPIHTKYIIPQGHAPLKFRQLIVWRWLATIVAYLFLSFGYSLVSLAFKISFTAPPAPHDVVAGPATAYGHGSFPVYWMLNYIGMCALGLACENVAMIIGQPWTALWLIAWVITNVCTSFYNITLSPRFFYWGYAWPLHHIVQGSRTILFDTKSHIGENFGVLFAWTAVSTALFPFCCAFMRWKTEKGKASEQGKPKPTIAQMFRQ
ncbi:MAG: hypothetical protein Q9227_009504 [Pyrenula ochraceoflavens]